MSDNIKNILISNSRIDLGEITKVFRERLLEIGLDKGETYFNSREIFYGSVDDVMDYSADNIFEAFIIDEGWSEVTFDRKTEIIEDVLLGLVGESINFEDIDSEVVEVIKDSENALRDPYGSRGVSQRDFY